MHQGVYEELKRVARSKNVTNYTAIGNMIGLDMGNPGDRNKIAKILDEINYHEHQYGRPMISAVVIRQDINMPGEGFFECARQLSKYKESNDLIFWVHELASVHNYWTTKKID
jgi:hypothetical protein